MAIYTPDQMDFSNKKFSMIISGSPGIGKTTLALSAPDPILIDFDKGISRVKAQHRKMTIMADTYEEILKDMESPQVQSAQTVVIDTGGSFVTYLQDWAKRSNPTLNCQRNGALSQKGFGTVKAEFCRFTNQLQYVMNKNIIYVFHTVEEKDGDVTKHRLLCEGSARNIVWQPCDLGCFFQIVGGKRVAGFTPTEQYFAKGCFGIKDIQVVPELDDEIPNDFITKLFERAKQNIAAEASVFQDEREKYETAMKAAREIIDSVVDADSALAAGKAVKGIPHCLTSEKESKAMLARKIKKMGLKWDKEAGQYVSAD